MPTRMLGPTIRPILLARDILSLTTIDRSSFDVPWTAVKFSKQLTGCSAPLTGLAAIVDNRMVGFILYRLASTDVAIRRLAVDYHYRKQGVGTSLVSAAAELSRGRRQWISTTVDEHDLRSQLFLRSQGFKWTSTLPAKISGLSYDQYHMTRPISVVSLSSQSGKFAGAAS